MKIGEPGIAVCEECGHETVVKYWDSVLVCHRCFVKASAAERGEGTEEGQEE